MASSLSPYEPVTFVFTDQSAIMRFYPDRDGLITNDWNVTYTDSSFVDWSYDHNFGTGNSSHRTMLEGASMVIDWAGTEVFVYGEPGSEGAYEAYVDGKVTQHTPDPSYPALLFSQTGLPYGLHTAVLNVTGGEVSITGSAITINMSGKGNPTVRNIYAVDNTTSPLKTNPLFVGDAAEWTPTALYTNQTADGYNCLTTSTYGAKLNFTLSGAAAFMIAGSCDWTQGLFTVAVTSDTPGATSSITDNTIQYSARSLWTQGNYPKYLASGLDVNATYTVEITNLGANFNLAAVYVYDTGSAPETSSSVSPSSTGSRSSSPSASAKAAKSTSNSMKTRRPQMGMVLVCSLLMMAVALL